MTPQNFDIHKLDLDTLFYVRESMVGAGVVERGHFDRAVVLIDEIIGRSRGPRPEPHELWQQAEGDQDRYVDLMIQHGHLVRGRREPGTDIFGHALAAPSDAPEKGR